ncbi:hypothetical protein [Leptospira stimsonii]|uniref:DUF4349 domain-containing protein n=1 Tax=Leptospira stimsonii TaxID=2202203 RepID=A0ABY2N237_9LEPT|nr:hypothetical protein [Leptospira stimsonii]TGK12809.1 hypothetical protein EHO98_19410 [Leptospira stimsonii]TGM14469.1 hypothetical protein EHQ90_11380 [Leptospira stimsonii]
MAKILKPLILSGILLLYVSCSSTAGFDRVIEKIDDQISVKSEELGVLKSDPIQTKDYKKKIKELEKEIDSLRKLRNEVQDLKNDFKKVESERDEYRSLYYGLLLWKWGMITGFVILLILIGAYYFLKAYIRFKGALPETALNILGKLPIKIPDYPAHQENSLP